MHHRFEGRLTARDCKRHLPHSFTLPAGCAALDIRLHFAPFRVQGRKNLITLTLFDPDGFRGAGHRGGDTHQVRIAADAATPGYAPGPLPAGEWIVQLDTHMIMPGEAVSYELDIDLTEGAGERAAAAADTVTTAAPTAHLAPQPLRGPGWYRGDLHSHTQHSDAANRSVAELLQEARAAGLDFIFVTDHNTATGLAELDTLPADGLLAARGIELTTFWGHALCLGAREWADWRVRPGTGAMARIADAAYAAGQVFIIAHPLSNGDPGCTGCAWRYGDMMPGSARLVEIWNGPWQDSNNEAALALWYDWLNQGRRMAATAGTDTHSASSYARQPGFNVIYAEELSEPTLLRALLAGRLYLSAGPGLRFEAHDESGARAISGDTVTQPAAFTAAWERCPADVEMRVIANGRLLFRQEAGAQGELTWAMSPEQAHWVTLEIRDREGGLLAVANPIYLHIEAV